MPANKQTQTYPGSLLPAGDLVFLKSLIQISKRIGIEKWIFKVFLRLGGGPGSSRHTFNVPKKITCHRKSIFFTLGGASVVRGNLIQGSELDFLLDQRSLSFSGKVVQFIQPQQYVSVEEKTSIHRENSLLWAPINCMKPTWLHGQFGPLFEEWCSDPGEPKNKPGIVNADLMSGIEVALPTIHQVFDTLKKNNIRQCLVVANVLERNQHRINMGKTFLPVWETVQQDKKIQSLLRDKSYSVRCVDHHQYSNKTMGRGAGSTIMETMMFWIS